MKKLLVTFLFAVLSISAFGHGDHGEREEIKGSGFDFAKVKDIIVGTFDNYPVWAEKKCGSHIRGQYKKDAEGEIKTFSVEVVDQVISGTFGDKKINFVGVDRENKIIKLSMGDVAVPIHYKTESFEDGHFHGITWTFTVHGEEHNVYLDGECCLGSMIFYSVFFYGLTTI